MTCEKCGSNMPTGGGKKYCGPCAEEKRAQAHRDYLRRRRAKLDDAQNAVRVARKAVGDE